MKKLIIILFSFLMFTSCALFRPKCPMPSCKTRKEHQHAIVFDLKALRKQERERKKKKFLAFFGIDSNKKKEKAVDSLSTAEVPDTTAEFNEFNEEPVASEDPIPLEETKSKKRKKKKENSEELDSETPSDEELLHPEEKKKFTWPWKKKKNQDEMDAEGLESEEDLDLDDGEELSEEDDFLRKWKSRMWRFWNNQNPKVGQKWKSPKKK